MNDVLVRSLTGAILVVLAVLAALTGGYVLALLVAAAATAMYYEWMRLVRGWGLGWSISGFFYALLPALALLWLRDRAEDGLALLLWVFLVTWSVDIGGYFAGRQFGRTPLAPTISPKKTVEGLLGGVLLAALVSAGWVAGLGLSFWLIILAPLFAVAAQGGDLFESALKRRAGVKDSGNWLPGHGGLLDRLDGLVPVALLTLAAELAGLV